jgi:hypothetical protein
VYVAVYHIAGDDGVRVWDVQDGCAVRVCEADVDGEQDVTFELYLVIFRQWGSNNEIFYRREDSIFGKETPPERSKERGFELLLHKLDSSGRSHCFHAREARLEDGNAHAMVAVAVGYEDVREVLVLD